MQQALVAAIRAGDDTDTVGAITGTLLGARYGHTAFPRRWTTPLHGWPGLVTTDLERLANQILDAR